MPETLEIARLNAIVEELKNHRNPLCRSSEVIMIVTELIEARKKLAGIQALLSPDECKKHSCPSVTCDWYGTIALMGNHSFARDGEVFSTEYYCPICGTVILKKNVPPKDKG